MDFENLNVVEVLRIENVELYETHAEASKLINKGTLLLLHSQEHNWYILKVNDWNYGLAKSIPLLASTHENGALRAYVLINTGGYFVIKVKEGAQSGNLDRLDSILQHNTDFAYKEGADGDGLPIKLGHGTVHVKKTMTQDGKMIGEDGTDIAKLIYDGGKGARKIIVSTAQVISVGMNKVGNHVQTNYVEKGEEKEVSAKTVKRMAFANSVSSTVSSTSGFYVKGLMSLGKTIAQKIESRFEKKQNEEDIAKMQAQKKLLEEQQQLAEKQARGPIKLDTTGAALASVHAVINVWHGMVEALEIIRVGFTEATGGVVAHKYGPAVAEAFKVGMGIAGNIGIPGSKFIKKIY